MPEEIKTAAAEVVRLTGEVEALELSITEEKRGLIESLTNLETHPVIRSWLDTRDAVKLGIEALKHYQIYKRNELIDPSFLLPGETKD
ncbi:hypothetical protein ES708_33623 [subsurface metagenome]